MATRHIRSRCAPYGMRIGPTPQIAQGPHGGKVRGRRDPPEITERKPPRHMSKERPIQENRSGRPVPRPGSRIPIVVILLSVFPAPARAQILDFPTVLHDARILTMAGPVIEDGSIVIKGGVIIAIFNPDSAPDVATPEQARALARHLVRRIWDPRVHHAVDIGHWEEGNPLVWNIGDIDSLATFSSAAVVLCGDAAHPMIPVVGQGANRSFEDAWRLASHLQDLAKTASPMEVSSALERYSRERAPHVARVQNEARRRMLPFRFTSPFAYRLYRPMLRSMPQRILDRFDEHLLAYASADPSWS